MGNFSNDVFPLDYMRAQVKRGAPFGAIVERAVDWDCEDPWKDVWHGLRPKLSEWLLREEVGVGNQVRTLPGD